MQHTDRFINMLLILGTPGNVELALEYFQKCYDAFGVYSNKIEDFKSYMRTIGYTDETETVTFRK